GAAHQDRPSHLQACLADTLDASPVILNFAALEDHPTRSVNVTVPLAAFQAVIEARLALPFATVVLGIPVTVTAIQDRPGSGIAARCRCSS
ncbi:hypothetical protein ACFVYV_53215, partial [Streptomyces mirabilis]